jgi:hypothetical protein
MLYSYNHDAREHKLAEECIALANRLEDYAGALVADIYRSTSAC